MWQQQQQKVQRTRRERMAHTRSTNNNNKSSSSSSGNSNYNSNNTPLRPGQSSDSNKELATLLFEYYSNEKDMQEEEEEEEEQKQHVEAELAVSTSTIQDSGFVQQSSRQHDHHCPPIQQQKHSLGGSDWSDLQWFDFQAPSFGYSNEEAEGPISSFSLPRFSFSTLLGDDAANTDQDHVDDMDDNERKNVEGCKEKEEKDNEGLASLSSLSLNNAPIGSGLHFARSKKLERRRRRTHHQEVNRVAEQREAEYQRLERQFEMEMEMMEMDLGFIAPYHTDQQDHQQQNQQHQHQQQEMDNSPRYLHQRRGNHITQSLSHTSAHTHTIAKKKYVN